MALDDREYMKERYAQAAKEQDPYYDPKPFRRPQSNREFWKSVAQGSRPFPTLNAFAACLALAAVFIAIDLFHRMGDRAHAASQPQPSIAASVPDDQEGAGLDVSNLDGAQPPAAAPTAAPAPSPAPSPAPPPGPTFSAPLLPQYAEFPPGGTVRYYVPVDPRSLVMPFTIRCAPGHDLMHVVRVRATTTAQLFADVYIRPGDSVDLWLPPGAFYTEVRVGRHWRVPDQLFAEVQNAPSFTTPFTSAPGAHAGLDLGAPVHAQLN